MGGACPPCARTAPARRRGSGLLKRLGFTVERLVNRTHLLKGADRRLGLAILLDRTDVPEDSSPKFGNLSPVSYALAKADNENLDWVMVLQGDRLRLYPTKLGVGVGRRGRTETFVELQTSLLADDHLAYLTLMLLRDWFNDAHLEGPAKAADLIRRVLDTGLAPFEQPALLPPIEIDEVRLVCWMGIEATEALTAH